MLKRTLESIALQNVQPKEIIIIDASENNETFDVCNDPIEQLNSKIVYLDATVKGAAVQRNQGIERSGQDFILFMDDDILLEPACIENLWKCMNRNEKIVGANAMITNQRYHDPGKATRIMYRLMHGKKLDSYAGKCIGPAWNLLPQDKEPEYNEIEWMNLGCTLYKKIVLPVPAFPDQFKGYSLMEDLALSLKVAKAGKLYNVITAKIFHDSQPGTHKSSAFKISKMELFNRHFIMTGILGRKSFSYHLKLIVFEMWGMVTMLRSMSGIKNFLPVLFGKLAASFSLLFKKK